MLYDHIHLAALAVALEAVWSVLSCILSTYSPTYYLTSSMPKRKKEMMNSAGMVAQ